LAAGCDHGTGSAHVVQLGEATAVALVNVCCMMLLLLLCRFAVQVM
jgi:hypothetical protein